MYHPCDVCSVVWGTTPAIFTVPNFSKMLWEPIPTSNFLAGIINITNFSDLLFLESSNRNAHDDTPVF